MRTLLGTVALALVACSGNVVVDNPSATGGGSTTTGTTSGTITVTVTTGSCSPTCSAVLTTGGPAPCGGSALSAYQGLLGCGCGGGSVCNSACGANFCSHAPASSPCQMCLATCGPDYQICTTN